MERLSLTADGKGIDYTFVVQDPEYLAEPITATYQWHYRPELEPSGVECDLDVAGRNLRETRLSRCVDCACQLIAQ